jgi:N-acetylmuramoyl-L-alanine amidase
MAAAIKYAIMDYKKELDQNIGSHILGLDNDTRATEVESPMIIEGVTFKIQIAASSKALEPKSYNFKGLSEISREKVGKIYKYFSGNTSDYNKAKRLQGEAKSNGYKDAFIIAYKDGNKIDVADALKSASN